ncbi:MAG: hypothetical protein CTY15_07855 [Methylocystis sp.]|nr:MAG: hypothetical protein CTY15_07855 [Methylocystis sp.]
MTFDTLYAALTSNQLLVGGVGTLAFGTAMYLLRAVPEKIFEFVEKTAWTKVFVESMSNEYDDVDAFIEGKRLNFFSRSLEIKDGELKTGFGGGWGVYDGKLFSSRRSTRTPSRFRSMAPAEAKARCAGASAACIPSSSIRRSRTGSCRG